MSVFARVALDFFPGKEFDYRVPSTLAASVAPGTRVLAPFGKSVKSGTVVSLQKQTAVDEAKLKDLAGISPEISFLDDGMLELLGWIQRYYGGSMGKVMRSAVPGAVRSAEQRVIKRLEKKGRIRVRKETALASLSADTPIVFAAPKPVLNADQKKAVDTLNARLNDGFRCVLLYGVTGSGKTEVYLRVIEQALAMGKTALVLVPEISLTPQTIDRFRSRFQHPMAVLHSGLTEAQRYDQWSIIRRGEASIVVGARSAVFAPMSNLGVIIVDEEQERSFKQQEAPHYHARDVAVMRAKLQKALVLLASATPALETYDNAMKGKYELLELSSRVDKRAMPRIEILDMRREMSKDGRNVLLSARLAGLIQTRLDRKEQTMLFLNRRGYHRCLWCPTCDKALQCPHCSITLTYHKVGTRLMCHLCGYTRQPLSRCPQCAADMLLPQGHGTQKIEGIVRKLFPSARVARMDADTTQGKDSHRDILSRFALGHFDILVGTQMIAKGHDFPNVTLVGVLNADTGLNVPDFRAAEQTYQLLTQVAGRAGRGTQGGEVIVQTRMPEHFLMAAVKEGNYRRFYDREIALRRELHYPPDTHMILVGVRHPGEGVCEQAAKQLHDLLRGHLPGTSELFMPVAAPIQKSKDLHRWQLLIKTNAVSSTQEHIRRILEAETFASGVLIDVDVDPQVLM